MQSWLLNPLNPFRPLQPNQPNRPYLYPHTSYGYIRRKQQTQVLSKVIRDMMEQKFGQAVRYPKDCDALAVHICATCKSRISGSTLRRLYGFTKGTQEPRLYTLDVIGEYLGYRGWEDLSRLLTGSETRPYTELEELDFSQVKKGEKVEIHYEPNRSITIHALSKGKIKVDVSNDKAVKLGDLLTFERLRLHYPMNILSIERNNIVIEGCYLGIVSGITSIRKIQNA